MKRVKIAPRTDYVSKIENIGFAFHTDYWKENAYYEFSMPEIEAIENATNECYQMYCDAAQYVIDHDAFGELMIPDQMKQLIIQSWNDDLPSLYGRFDFALINGVPKLMEFNGDTPTSLLEASIIQWNWKEECFPQADQFNALHEALVQSWKDIHNVYLSSKYHFACCQESEEDAETLEYILATAHEAGLNAVELDMEQLFLDNGKLFDPSGDPIDSCFKLYPWEWMWKESPEGIHTQTNWIEPAWKALMSNKAMLPMLSQLFPDSPYILKCHNYLPYEWKSFCKKPIFGREGSNVVLVKDGKTLEDTRGDYGQEGYVFQELIDLPQFDDRFPIIGSWIIGGEACGMGIRETQSRITDNLSEFVPHIII